MAEYTFLGLQPYTEADAYRFKGRTEESQELFRLIVRNDYTVCYAESGEGKTSLLNAGVFPLLRQNMFFPIAITFTSDDYERTPDRFDTIIDRCIKDSIADYNEKNKGINIEYKLCSTDFQDTNCQSALQQELGKYSWWKLRNYKPQAMGLTFTPVFVFDQFEEVFNLPGSIVWTKIFFDWLEDVSSDSCPDEIVNKVREIIGINAAFPAIKEEKDFKAVFSLRKEFIGELDYWGMQKCFIPSLKDNRYCLKSLTYKGAKKVMAQQQRFEECKVEQVLSYFVQQYSREPEKTIGENLPVIPALLLSVVCDSWEKDINYFSDIEANDIDQSLNKILEKFYDEAVGSVVNEIVKQHPQSGSPDFIREDIETAMFDLVDVNGKRVRTKATTTLGTIRLAQAGNLRSEELRIVKYKKVLSDHRIIKISKVDSEDYVEIVHDALCPIIAKRKEKYLAAEAKKREEEKMREQAQKNRKRMLLMSSIILIAFLIIGFFYYQNRKIKQFQWQIMETQARSVSEKAMELISEGDLLRGIALVMNVLPDDINNPNRPFVPEAERALRAANDSVLFGFGPICMMKQHFGCVYDAACSSNGIVVTTSNDNTIRLWNLETGEEYLQWRSEDFLYNMNYISISPNGKYLIKRFSEKDPSLSVWRLDKNGLTYLKKLVRGKHPSFSIDGKHLFIEQYSDVFSDFQEKEITYETHNWDSISSSIKAGYYSPDRKLLIVSTNGNGFDLLNANTKLLIGHFKTSDISVSDIVQHSDNTPIVISKNNKYAIYYNDIVNLETKNVIPFDGEFLSFCDGGNTIMITKTVYGEKYYELKKYLSFINPDNGKEYHERRIKLPGSVRVAFECYNGRIFVGLENGISCVYRYSDANNHVWEKLSLPFQYSYYSGYSWQTRDKCRIIKEEGCKFSSNLKYAIIRQEDSLHIYKLFGKKYILIRSLNFSDRILSIIPGAPIVVAKHTDILEEDTIFDYRREITLESVVLYNIDNNSKLLIKKDTCYDVSLDAVMSISNDGRFVAYPYGNTILLKDAQCDSIKNKMNGHFNTIKSITFSAEGKNIVSTSSDNTVRVWQVSNGKELDDKRICYPIEEHVQVERAVLSPNNKFIAILVGNHIDLYDFEKNSLIETITIKEQINTIDFSEDSKKIYALCKTGIFVREIPSFEVLYNKFKHLKNYELSDAERKKYFLQ